MSHSAAMSTAVVEIMLTVEKSMLSAAVLLVLAIEVDLATVKDTVPATVKPVQVRREGAPTFELVLVTGNRVDCEISN